MSVARQNLKEARCGEPTNPRANLRSDEQKPYMRLRMRIRLPKKSKSNSYTESCVINMADGWGERACEYPRRSVRNALKEVSITQSNVERAEVSRGHSSGDVKDRINRSL